MTTKNLKDLYIQTKDTESEIIFLQERLKELKDEYTFNKDYCKDGFDKQDVNKTMRAAKSKAKEENLQEKVDTLNEIVGIQEQYD